jgi:hypothetical protein
MMIQSLTIMTAIISAITVILVIVVFVFLFSGKR